MFIPLVRFLLHSLLSSSFFNSPEIFISIFFFHLRLLERVHFQYFQVHVIFFPPSVLIFFLFGSSICSVICRFLLLIISRAHFLILFFYFLGKQFDVVHIYLVVNLGIYQVYILPCISWHFLILVLFWMLPTITSWHLTNPILPMRWGSAIILRGSWSTCQHPCVTSSTKKMDNTRKPVGDDTHALNAVKRTRTMWRKIAWKRFDMQTVDKIIQFMQDLAVFAKKKKKYLRSNTREMCSF